MPLAQSIAFALPGNKPAYMHSWLLLAFILQQTAADEVGSFDRGGTSSTEAHQHCDEMPACCFVSVTHHAANCAEIIHCAAAFCSTFAGWRGSHRPPRRQHPRLGRGRLLQQVRCRYRHHRRAPLQALTQRAVYGQRPFLRHCRSAVAYLAIDLQRARDFRRVDCLWCTGTIV